MGVFSARSKATEQVQDPITPQTTNLEAGDGAKTEHAETLSPAPTSATTPQKWALSAHASDGDTALTLFSHPDDLQEVISPQDEARLQRKIDLMILPYLAVCYAFFYIDKTTLSYAAIFGIRDDLKLVGTQYSWLSSIFYFGFLAWACMSSLPSPVRISTLINGRFILIMSYSPNQLPNATIPYWQILRSQYLHVGSISHATSHGKELYTACYTPGIFRGC